MFKKVKQGHYEKIKTNSNVLNVGKWIHILPNSNYILIPSTEETPKLHVAENLNVNLQSSKCKTVNPLYLHNIKIYITFRVYLMYVI